jgi:PKD repeat protein
MKHFSIYIVSLVLVLLPFYSNGQTDFPSTGRIVVKYNPSVSELRKAQLREEWQGERLASLEEGTLEVWDLSRNPSLSGQTSQAVAEKLAAYARQKSEILYTEPDYIFEAAVLTNDPHFFKQWGLSNTGQNAGTAGADIHLPSQWDQQDGSQAIIAGIIDTGIDWGHEDLVDNIWQNLAEDADGDGHTIEFINGAWELDPGDLNGNDDDGNGYVDDLVGWDFVNDDNNPFDDNGHGTHVAGILGAKGNNGKGIAGVSWHTRMMALKAFDDKGSGSVISIIPALEYARMMGARITNDSWGGPAYSQALYDELALSNAAGMLNIVAAGNNGSNNSATPTYPGSFDLSNVICVAATNNDDSLAVFSNYSYSLVDVAAPGQDIYSTLPGHAYGYKNGTSMATPMVAGAIALIWSQDTTRSHNQIREMLLSTVDQIPGLAGKCATGGRINLSKAGSKSQVLCSDYAINTDAEAVTAIMAFDNKVWMGSILGIYESDKFNCQDTIWNTNNVLSNERILSLAKDQQGNLWAGTEGGLFRYDGNSWVNFNAANSDIPDNEVEYIYAGGNDTLWMTIKGKGFAKFDGTNWTPYETLAPGYPVVPINVLMHDSVGAFWIGHSKGVAKIAGNDTILYDKSSSGLPEDNVLCMAVDSLNQMWFGVEKGGLVRLLDSTWTVFNSGNSGLVHDDVQAITIDHAGNIWVGTPDGINKFDGTDWILYDDTDPLLGLPHNDILSLHTDENNNVWVGTAAGVYVFSSNALMASFTSENAPCLNVPVDFQNTSIGGSSYEWLIEGDMVSTNVHLTHTFTAPGSYTVYLVAKNPYTTDTLTQEIKILPLPSVNLGPDTTACAAAIVLDAGIVGMRYQWKNTLGTVLGSQRTFRADSSGSYVLEVISSCGATMRDTISLTLSGDCVWAGDVNADGKVNMLDYLSLGIAHGSSGAARPAATTQWQSEPATDWAESFAASHSYGSNINYKHADCNGDGVIDIATDGAVVMQNAGYIHEPIHTPGPKAISLSVEPTLTTMDASDTLTIYYDVYLNDNQGASIEGVYGVAFTLDYNLPLSQAPVVEIDSALSGELSAAIITYDDFNEATGSQVNYFQRTMAFGAVSTSQSNTTVNSRIARMGVIVVLEDVQDDNGVMDFVSLSLTPGNLVVIDSAGAARPVKNHNNSATSTVVINIPNVVLPVKWLDFYAKMVDNKVALNWLTAQESGLENYTVQRSLDGIRFENLGHQASQAISDEPTAYEFVDPKPLPGVNFYRIQRREQDGSIVNSELINIWVDNQELDFLVFPNPTKGPIEAQIVSPQAENGRLRVLSTLGKVYHEQAVSIQQGSQRFALNLQELSPGIYYLEYSGETAKKVFKFLKQ